MSELLTRLGVRTVSIDLSWEMMRRGRDRLAADSRLVFSHQAAFVAGRGQALPFIDHSFEGVVCMNALHHFPSYELALREIYRVLKPGGRAVFSEPGNIHAQAELSRFRMREEGVIEKSVVLPVLRNLAFEVGFSQMRVVPLRSSEAYAFEYAAAPSDEESLRTVWADTLRLYPGEYARFVLQKGDDSAQDTLLPVPKLNGRLRAEIRLEGSASTVKQGTSFTDRLRIQNTGSVTWKARGRRFGGQVTCGLKVCDLRGTILREDLGRTPLPRDVAPGDAIALEIHVPAALHSGRYLLRYDMVVEGVTWFEFQGSRCVDRLLDVVGVPLVSPPASD